MAKNRLTGIILFMSLIITIVLTACSPKTAQEQALAPVQEQAVQEAPVVLMNGTCVYIEGSVTLLRAGNERPMELGDEIISGDTIKTGSNAICELQFGSTAKLQLQAQTVLEVTDVLLSDVSRRVAAKLEIGSILNKVQKLSGTDSYTIRTGSTVCGVRGTEFVVKVDSTSTTVIAVKKGKVAALPATATLDKIIQEAATNAVASAALETLVANTPVIVENQEMTINKDVVAAAEIVHKEMEKVIASVAPIPFEKEEEAPIIAPVITYEAPEIVNNVPVKPSAKSKPALMETPEVISAIQQVVQSVQTTAQKPVVKPRPVSNQFNGAFKQLDSIEPPQSTTPSEGTSSQSSSEAQVVPEQPKSVQENKPAEKPATTVTKPAETPVQTKKPALEYVAIPALKRAVSGNIVRSLAGNAFIVSDKNGTVTAFSDSGQRLWVVNTENKGTERTYAVPFKDFIYYSGSTELVIIDAKSGKIINRIALDSNKSHLLGNRVVPFPNAVVFPTKTGLDVLSPATGEIISSIEIPGGSMMTPANYDGKAVIVSQRGILYIVNIEKGSIETEIKTPAVQPTAQAPKIFKALACFADRKGLLVLVDLNTGTVKWTKQLEGSNGIFTDLEFAQEGIFAFGNDTLFAYSLEGTPLFDPIKNVAAPPALIRGKLVYANKDNQIVSIEANTGKLLTKLTIDVVGSSRPLFFNGFVYMGLNNGSVIKIPAEKLGIK
ncbi:MAG TPA: PQQ-binding-like beta-propeller repeat protein [Spirochaetales bacterium]|nr:PQQ-binding-like beta-propeller repeat protein [Spirochaetales bacterium]